MGVPGRQSVPSLIAPFPADHRHGARQRRALTVWRALYRGQRRRGGAGTVQGHFMTAFSMARPRELLGLAGRRRGGAVAGALEAEFGAAAGRDLSVVADIAEGHGPGRA